jgi:hypothetical protein
MSVAIAFNSQLDKFLDELIKTFPEDKDFPYYKRLVDQLRKVNVRKPIELYAFTVHKHIKLIENRDSDFFFNNFGKIVSEETDNKNNQAEAFRLFENIKLYWIEMPEDNKKVIWDYLTVLTKLAVKFLVETPFKN